MSKIAPPARPLLRQARAAAARQTRVRSRGFSAAVGVAVAVVAIATGVGWYALQHGAGQGRLAGPLLRASPPAPNFTLRDQDGQVVQMASLKGRVVVLTFLYTRCPDACPLIVAKLAQGFRQLGADQQDVTMLAVSVDPANDTPGAAKAFDATYGLAPPSWHYLVGGVQELVPVWRAYHVSSGAAAQVAATSGDGGAIDHTGIVYLIDRRQRVRVALDVNFQTRDFVQDVRVFARS